MRSRCESISNISIWEHIEHMLGHKHMPSTHCLFQNLNLKGAAEWLWDQLHWPQVHCCWAWPGTLSLCQMELATQPHHPAKELRGLALCWDAQRQNKSFCAAVLTSQGRLLSFVGMKQHGFGMWSSVNRCCHCCTDHSSWVHGQAPKAFWRARVPQNHLLI